MIGSLPVLLPLPADSGGNGQQRSFNYLFYIDFIGSLADPQAQNALRHLQARARGVCGGGWPGGEVPGQVRLHTAHPDASKAPDARLRGLG